MASIRLDDSYEKRIKETGLNRSEVVRRALDLYFLHLDDPHTHLLLVELERWIAGKRDGVTHMNTSVTQCSTDVTHSNTDVTQCSTGVTICNTNTPEITQKTTPETQNSTQNHLATVMKNDLQTIQLMLLNPENLDSVPDYTLKLLSKKYDISKSTIQAWVTENKEWLKHEDFTEM